MSSGSSVMAVILGASSLLALGLTVACKDDDANAKRPEEASASSALDVDTEQICEAMVELTYLPWLSAGDEPIAPAETPFEVEGQIVANWFEDGTDDSALLQLIIDTNPRPSIVGGDDGAVSGDPIGIFLDEVEGEFGINPDRGGGFLWELNEPGCTAIALTLWLDLPEEEVREELARIARSLQSTR